MPVPFNPEDPAWIEQENAALDAAVPPDPGVTVTLEQLPTADPHVNGQIWNDNGQPTVSNG